MHGLVYYRNTLYLQYSLYSWVKTDGQEVMYLDYILQNPQEIAFPRLGFDFIPLAYFEVCYKKLPCGICFLHYKAATWRQF